MAHIVIDARIINSGTGRYIERLLAYLQEIDHKNSYTVLLLAKDKDYWKPRVDNFAVTIADFDQYSFAEQLGLNNLLKSLKPDLVHFCMPQQPILYKGKKVTTFHDLILLNTYNSDKNWFVYHAKQLVGRYAFKKALADNNHIITVSDYTSQELKRLFGTPSDKITHTYEGSDVSSVKPKRYPVPFKRYILYVGQQSDYKNIKRLGDAHQLLLAKDPSLGLVLAGRKNAAALTNEAYFKKRGYTNIHFTDFVPDDQLSWLYTHAEAYVFPSLMEGFGLPGLEALSHGIPLVCSNATCLPEVYGNAAHYFTPTDTSEMAAAIDEVLSNKKLREKLIKAGSKQVKKYSWKKMAKETHAIYEKVLKS